MGLLLAHRLKWQRRLDAGARNYHSPSVLNATALLDAWARPRRDEPEKSLSAAHISPVSPRSRQAPAQSAQNRQTTDAAPALHVLALAPHRGEQTQGIAFCPPNSVTTTEHQRRGKIGKVDQ